MLLKGKKGAIGNGDREYQSLNDDQEKSMHQTSAASAATGAPFSLPLPVCPVLPSCVPDVICLLAPFLRVDPSLYVYVSGIMCYPVVNLILIPYPHTHSDISLQPLTPLLFCLGHHVTLSRAPFPCMRACMFVPPPLSLHAGSLHDFAIPDMFAI